MSYEISALDRVIPNKAIAVRERAEDGTLLGEYRGYYNPDKGVFNLYPAYNIEAKNNGKLNKRIISDKLIKRVEPEDEAVDVD